MNMNWIGLSYMTVSTGIGLLSLYLAYKRHKENQQLQAENTRLASRIPLCVSGQSDVCKDEEWMPFGEVVR